MYIIFSNFFSDLSQRLICPTFAPFEFTSWKVGDEDSFCDVSRLKDKEEEEDQDAHRFDVNAVPEPLDDDPYFDADDEGRSMCMGF